MNVDVDVEVGVALEAGDDSVADMMVELEIKEDVAVDEEVGVVADGSGTVAVTRAIAMMH